MNFQVCVHTLVPYGGKIWRFGGHNGGRACTTIECYDPETNVWTVMEEQMFPRPMSTAGVMEHGIAILGGVDTKSGKLRTGQFFSPETRKWTEMEPMASARGLFGVATFTASVGELDTLLSRFGQSCDASLDPTNSNIRSTATATMKCQHNANCNKAYKHTGRCKVRLSEPTDAPVRELTV